MPTRSSTSSTASTPDTTGFGSPNGYLMFDFPGGGSGQSFLAGLAIEQSDGKIIAVGHPNGATGIGVARITTTGALDTTFDGPPGSGAGGTAGVSSANRPMPTAPGGA